MAERALQALTSFVTFWADPGSPDTEAVREATVPCATTASLLPAETISWISWKAWASF